MGILGVLLLVWQVCAMSFGPMAGSNVSDANEVRQASGVTVALRKFDMTDQTLELQCETANGSDHDVWICESIETDALGSLSHAPWMEPDGRTLVIRRRLGLEPRISTGRPLRLRGQYVRVTPGQRHTAPFTMDLPVLRSAVFASGAGGVTGSTRLIVEIGFYDEDLPRKVHSILEMADRLGCVLPPLNEMSAEEMNILFQYFGGVWIFGTFKGGVTGFDAFYQEGSDSVEIPWEWPIDKDESLLKIVVDGVSVPCAG